MQIAKNYVDNLFEQGDEVAFEKCEDGTGICLECGELYDDISPDTEGQHCLVCDEPEVCSMTIAICKIEGV